MAIFEELLFSIPMLISNPQSISKTKYGITAAKAKPTLVKVVKYENTVPEIFSPTSRFNLSEISATIALINGSGPENAKPYKTIKEPTAKSFGISARSLINHYPIKPKVKTTIA